MATAREIVTRALRRLRIVAAGETPSAEDADIGLTALNSLVASWPSQGVETLAQAVALDDTWSFFVPPAEVSAETIDLVAYVGTWNASTNTPTLASSAGTRGRVYKVSVAGSTALNDVASWSVGDYALFDGSVWLKADSSARFDRAVVDLLAMELCPDFGKAPDAMLAQGARRGWTEIAAAFVKAPTAQMGRALMDTYSRSGLETEEIAQ